MITLLWLQAIGELTSGSLDSCKQQLIKCRKTKQLIRISIRCSQFPDFYDGKHKHRTGASTFMISSLR
jgi:hypothetical protein